MRPAQAPGDAVRRRLGFPFIALVCARVAVRQQGDEDGSDGLLILRGDKAGLLNKRTVPARQHAGQRFSGRQQARLVIQAAKGLDRAERRGEERSQAHWLDRVNRLYSYVIRQSKRPKLQKSVVMTRPRAEVGVLVQVLVLVRRIAGQLPELLDA